MVRPRTALGKQAPGFLNWELRKSEIFPTLPDFDACICGVVAVKSTTGF
jgi:hypothetical protein